MDIRIEPLITHLRRHGDARNAQGTNPVSVEAAAEEAIVVSLLEAQFAAHDARVADLQRLRSAGVPEYACFNDWFLAQSEGRQAALRDDKWMLAEAAFRAGRAQSAQAVAEPSIEDLCARIKAADDAAAGNDYMLDSNDCIKVLRGEWQAPLAMDKPALPTPKAEPAPAWDGKLHESLQRSLNAARLECPPELVNDLEFEVRQSFVALSTSLTMAKRMYGAARDRLDAIDAAQPDPFAARVAQPAVEPVAYIQHHKVGDNLVWDHPGGKHTPLYAAAPNALDASEQKAVLSDLAGLSCLINYHDCKEIEAEAMDFDAAFHRERVFELLSIGRALIDADPDVWRESDRADFVLRHSERTALAAQSAQKNGG